MGVENNTNLAEKFCLLFPFPFMNKLNICCIVRRQQLNLYILTVST